MFLTALSTEISDSYCLRRNLATNLMPRASQRRIAFSHAGCEAVTLLKSAGRYGRRCEKRPR